MPRRFWRGSQTGLLRKRLLVKLFLGAGARSRRRARGWLPVLRGSLRVGFVTCGAQQPEAHPWAPQARPKPVNLGLRLLVLSNWVKMSLLIGSIPSLGIFRLSPSFLSSHMLVGGPGIPPAWTVNPSRFPPWVLKPQPSSGSSPLLPGGRTHRHFDHWGEVSLSAVTLHLSPLLQRGMLQHPRREPQRWPSQTYKPSQLLWCSWTSLFFSLGLAFVTSESFTALFLLSPFTAGPGRWDRRKLRHVRVARWGPHTRQLPPIHGHEEVSGASAVPGMAEGTSVSCSGLLLTVLHLTCCWNKANDRKLPLHVPCRVFMPDMVSETPYLPPLLTCVCQDSEGTNRP